MINSLWSTLKALHFGYMISKSQFFHKTALLTLPCWSSPQKGFLGQKTFVWAKIISRVEEAESFKINFIVYLLNLTIGWNLLHKCFVLCPSFCKEPRSAVIFLILNKRFTSFMDWALKQCLCRKIESVRIKTNNNLNLTDSKKNGSSMRTIRHYRFQYCGTQVSSDLF